MTLPHLAEPEQSAPRQNWADAKQAVSRLTRKAHSSFFWPMMLMPREKREAIQALYAFCREADDAVDEAKSPASARARLAFWEAQLALAYSPGVINTGELHPVTLALLPAIRRYQLPRSHFDEILLGIGMDIRPEEMHAPTRKMLSLYCYRVAGCVGLQAIRIFGCRNPASQDYAIALGEALQLTNILRDVQEDMTMGRLYLPREYLAKYQLPHHDVQALASHPRLASVCRDLAADAHKAYQKADLLLPTSDKTALKPARMMQHIYFQLLNYVEARGFPSAPAPRPGKIKLLGWALRGVMKR